MYRNRYSFQQFYQPSHCYICYFFYYPTILQLQTKRILLTRTKLCKFLHRQTTLFATTTSALTNPQPKNLSVRSASAKSASQLKRYLFGTKSSPRRLVLLDIITYACSILAIILYRFNYCIYRHIVHYYRENNVYIYYKYRQLCNHN